MAIEIRCECCNSTIRVRDELAGRTGSCRHCGSSLTIPRPEDLLNNCPLTDASPDDMIRELRRRGRRSVLLMLDGDKSNLQAGDQVKRSLKQLTAIGADAFDQRQLADVYRHLADAAEQRASTIEKLEEEAERDVFALKGDELGMSLADFKRKYKRSVPGSNRVAPFCSDEYPDQAIPDLLAEDWHVAAGIVHARTDLPEEKASPTIAGVRTDLVLYQFLDGKLFQVSALFAPDAYHPVKAALTQKFGSPMDSEGSQRGVQWWSMASTIHLQAGSIRPTHPTVLAYRHDDLLREAAKRKPNASADL